LCWNGAASGRRKSEEPPLFLPIVRQSPGEHDEPGGRQLDGLVADQDRANDFRREIRETHEPRQIIAPHASRDAMASMLSGKDERAISVSGYVYREMVKLARPAYDKVTMYKGVSKNHLVSQVVGFRIGDKEAAKRADDLLDCFVYGVALSLGNAEGF
jgi:hypothetical protein